MRTGGYDQGYSNVECFWGKSPSSLVLKLDDYIDDYKGKRVLDLGCGEGKNTFYLAEKGCLVDAYDISEYAISNAKKVFGEHENVNINTCDVFNIKIESNKYDIIIAYGLFHCFINYNEVIEIINKCLKGIKNNGFFILCSFNSRAQDLAGHDNFKPLLLSHNEYVRLFTENEIIFQSDEDLFETHPHNNIPHSHSMTRLIIRKT